MVPGNSHVQSQWNDSANWFAPAGIELIPISRFNQSHERAFVIRVVVLFERTLPN